MISGFLLGGILTGGAAAVLYLLVRLLRKDAPQPNLEELSIVFLNGIGLVAATRLFTLVFSATFAIGDTDRAYLAVGGIAVFWISSKSIVTKVFSGRVANGESDTK